MGDEIKVISLSFKEKPKPKIEDLGDGPIDRKPGEIPVSRVAFKDDTPALVSVRELTKKYGTFTALNNVDLSIKKEKIIGLLGPNGSGKTTLIKILAGLLTHNSGTVKIDGKDIGEGTKAVVSYLPERPYFNSWMSVKQCLDFFEDFYSDFSRDIAEEMLEDLQINPKSKLRTLSKGTKEKVQLILVMSRRAKLYLLDEPIAGVDPAARDYILDTIISKYHRGASVIISTHLISDVENVLDEYIFIRKGDVIECGSVKKFKESSNESLDSHFREVFKYVH